MATVILKPCNRGANKKACVRCKPSGKSAYFSYQSIVSYQLSEMEKKEKESGYIRPDEVNNIGRVWKF